jgi:hypothetical protein
LFPYESEAVAYFMIMKILSVLLGLIVLPIAIMALLDPVGSKMADDSDPFGDPGGPIVPLILLAASLYLIIKPLFDEWKDRKTKRIT